MLKVYRINIFCHRSPTSFPKYILYTCENIVIVGWPLILAADLLVFIQASAVQVILSVIS